jgi:hypothetical protein
MRLRAALLFTAGLVLAVLAFGSLRSIAHADPVPDRAIATLAAQVTAPTAAAAPSQPWDVGTFMLIVIAVLVGIDATLSVASKVLHLVAPRTATTRDDRWAADVDAWRADVDKWLAQVSSVTPGSAATSSSSAAAAAVAPVTVSIPPRNLQSGKVSLVLMLAMLIGAAVPFLIGQSGCTQAQIKATEQALLDCTSGDRAAAVAAITPLADSAIALATNPDGSLDTAAIAKLFSGANLKSEAGTIASCVAVEVLGSRAAAAPTVAARSMTGAPPAPIGVSPAVALAQLRAAQFPGVKFRTPTGVN